MVRETTVLSEPDEDVLLHRETMLAQKANDGGRERKGQDRHPSVLTHLLLFVLVILSLEWSTIDSRQWTQIRDGLMHSTAL
jgi:hypothetical protein